VNPPPNRFLSLLKSTRDRPAIIAHRGDSFHAPENTLDAARMAWRAGAQAWELDVQLTRDGVPIVIHDDSLARTTDVAARFTNDPRGRDGFLVSEFDYNEIRNLDAGSWFVESNGGPRSARAFGTLDRLESSWIAHCRSGSVIIPTLADALDLTANLNWLVNIEIKSFPAQPPGLVASVLDLVEKTGTARSVLLSSFDHRDIERAAVVGRQYALGILVETPLFSPHDHASRVGADTVNLSAEYLGSQSIEYRRHAASSSLAGGVVEGLKTRGFPTLVYTVNDRRPDGLAKHLAEIGVAGLFTDDPAGLRNHFEAVSGATPGEPR
jgi:glycerophosphoryl diester phosphodiesterase